MKNLRLNAISRNAYSINSMSYPEYNSYQQWRIMVLRKGLSSISIYINDIIHCSKKFPIHLYFKSNYYYLNYKDNDIKYFKSKYYYLNYKGNDKKYCIKNNIKFLPKKNISLDNK